MKSLTENICRLLLFAVILGFFSHCREEPEIKVPLKLPYDTFWLSAEFDESPFTSVNEFFDTWIETSKYPAGELQTYYNYWETKYTCGERGIFRMAVSLFIKKPLLNGPLR